MATLTKISDEADKLYADLLKAATTSPEGMRKVFFQSDLQALAASSSTPEGTSMSSLMPLIQELTNHSLLRLSKLDRALCWSPRPRDAAKAITLLTGEEKLVYSHVEDAHQKGIWMRDLKKRTNLAQPVVQKVMGKLEGVRLVKSIKNVRAPAQKTFMLYHLVPSDDVTGGSFFDAGDLDESLIEELSNLIIFHVRMQSWADTKPKKIRRARSPSPAPPGEDGAAGNKRKRLTHDIEDNPRHKPSTFQDDSPLIDYITQQPYPAYTRTYPSAPSIHAFITTTDAIRASKAAQLTIAEIQQVIDVLVWDDKLEVVGGGGYRTVRGVKFRPPGYPVEDGDGGEGDGAGQGGNGLTQAPCGRCPVFELCGREGEGPVNVGVCGYWSDWLDNGA